ncbi:MAG: hypothetical protein KAH10_02045 [Flavobacteriales bacterium]|nr:hypothetical protein [Flavobacteriales bacterium]
MFADRSNAGFKLAEKLRELTVYEPIILAITNGGIETSLPIVDIINAPFDFLIAERLKSPFNPIANFGSIVEDGSIAFNDFEKFVNQEEKLDIISRAKSKLKVKIDSHRSIQEKIDITKRNVIIVDDGINFGSTMIACINSCKRRKVASITIATPVLSTKIYDELSPMVDKIIYLIKDDHFKGIEQYYKHYQNIDNERFNDRLSMITTNN